MADKQGSKRTGKVKWFNVTKGFGFITPDDGGEELFVHQSEIHAEGFRSLREGETVEFRAEEGDDQRIRAVDVTGPKGGHVQGRGRGAAPSRAPRPPAGASRGYGGPVCYNCNEPGHFARDCNRYAPSRGSGGAGRGCFTCGQQGHFAKDCPDGSKY